MTKKILLVLTDKDKSRLLQLTFRDEGYYVDVASTTDSAIELGKKNEYFAAFLNVKDEDIDGARICKAVKSANSKSRVIAMTSFNALYGNDDYKKAGYDASFPMPLDTHDLIRVVRNAIAGKALF
jgi:DNA-binding response OmpR family regulator